MLPAFRYGIVATAILGLLGCNGTTDNTDVPLDPTSYQLTLNYQYALDNACLENTSQQTFDVDQSFCVTAHLSNNLGDLSGEIINFSSNFGDLSQTSALTGSNGIATIIVNNSNQTMGAGTIQATFNPVNADSVSLSRNFAYRAADSEQASNKVSLVSSMLEQNGTLNTRFIVGSSVQLQAKLMDSDAQPIANKLVEFNLESTTLNPNSALTDSQGVARLSYQPSSSELGAYSYTVMSEVDNQTLTQQQFYEILAADSVITTETLVLGHLNTHGEFVEGTLGTSLPKNAEGDYVLSASGSFGINVAVASKDYNGNIKLLQNPATITLTSDCMTNESATLTSPITTRSGLASSTFTDVRCSGNSERDDVIIASTTVNNQALTAYLPITLARQYLGNISFQSAEPEQIRLQGSGGTNASESSQVSFKVTSANGLGAAQQKVNFKLDTDIGNVRLSGADHNGIVSALTNDEGMVSVRVLSGTMPTPVRVQATTTDPDTTETITTQSEQLTINTGLPQQLSMSLATSTYNPEAFDVNGTQVQLTARLADSFGNPVPDDTVINFTTEGGIIDGACQTVNGGCSVTWTSSNPKPQSDHRITVLAYALGHETFYDTNGNNVFDPDDGNPIIEACLATDGSPTTCSGNGMDIETYHARGFSDLGDPFRDDNENFAYDLGERYFNLSNANRYQGPDGEFNGPNCSAFNDDGCQGASLSTSYVRQALVMTMSGSSAYYRLRMNGALVFDSSMQPNLFVPIELMVNEIADFSLELFDSAGQIMPANTDLAVTISEGTLDFDGFTVPNTNQAGGSNVGFKIIAGETPTETSLKFIATTPSGVQTTQRLTVNYLLPEAETPETETPEAE